ncbi:MAG: GNAT family N-acetyltransferase [Bacteroidota bacterium]
MDPIIREALAEDMPAVLELIRELAVYEKEPDAVKVTVKELQESGFGKEPMFTCFVAEVAKEIVGMALIYFRFSTWVGKTVHLEDLVVRESMRGKGVGEALYTQVMRYAKEHGVKRVNWVVLGWNKGAIKFYERSGAEVMEEWWQVEMDEEGMNNYLNNQ